MSTMWVAVGLYASYLSLLFGAFYFAYALKYYASTLIALKALTRARPEEEPTQSIVTGGSLELPPEALKQEPFVSVHLPFYNEENVARRVIQACIDLDYSNYEVLVADDSMDGTIDVLKNSEWRTAKPIIKFIHRRDRSGYKGGALQQAQRWMHPDAEYVVVFDADFIPPPGIIHKFLDRFKEEEGNGKPVAAVQGYQLHHLNKTENWVTRGVRAEFSGSYMVERVAEQELGAMKMIAGSVFMLRADLLRELGWSTSITEDWELTLRLYIKGYRVVYSPMLQAPAEIPTTVGRLIRQRMRWAEGHTSAVREYFWTVMRSKKLTRSEKLEFLYFSPYYLQSLMFIVGTVCFIVSEVGNRRPQFWTPTLGWGLLLSNFLAIPVMMTAGMFLEGDLAEDYGGVFSFIALSYILTPYQAYAALRGLLGDEGTWTRTFKTGHITDNVVSVKFRALLSSLSVAGAHVQRAVSTAVGSLPVKRVIKASCLLLIVLPFSDRLLNLFLTLAEAFTTWMEVRIIG